MVYKVLLTQPLAAGPDGDWTQDVLMEGVPMTAFPFSPESTSTLAHTSTKDMSNGASGAHDAVLEYGDEAEISISEDDDEDEDYDDHDGDVGDAGDDGEASDVNSTEEMAICSSDAKRNNGSSVRNDDASVNGYSADAGLDTMYHVDKQMHQAGTKEESDDGDISSSDSVGGQADAYRVAERRGVDRPASPRNVRVSRENSTSPGIESIDIDEDRESDSSFDGSDDDEAEDADDSDSYEPDVPYPPCSLHHQDRKTYKQSLCEECYITYKSDLKAAGLYRGSDEEPGPEKRRRKKRVVKTKRRGRRDITSPNCRKRRGKEYTSGTDKRNRNTSRTKIHNSRAGAVSLRNRGRKRSRESASTSKKRRADKEQQRHRLAKERTSLSGDALSTGRVDSDDSSNDDSSSDTNTKARANAGNRLRVINRPTRRKTSTLPLSDNEGGVAANLLSFDPAPMDTEGNFELTKDGINRNGQNVEASERSSGSGAKEASKKPETAGVQGPKLWGQSIKSKTTELIPERGDLQMMERKSSDALLQPKSTPSEAVEALNLGELSQLKRGEVTDAPGRSEIAGMTGKVDRVDGSARDGNLSNTPASCAPNEPMHLNMKVPEKSGVGRLEKRKSGFGGQNGSKAGKKSRVAVSGNSVTPTSRATYERVTHYVGVVRKVTNGKFFLWVGDKLHDGKPYDSAEECAREYDKLQTANSRGGQFRPRLNFGDAKAPLHVETIGLTPLSAGPGSRIAKKIKSGYRVPNTTGPTPAPKKGAPFFAPSSALRKIQQDQQSRASAHTTPSESPPSNSLNIDLPMVRSSKESAELIPSFVPPDGSKIRWLNPISRERPLDGLHLPCAASATPARAAMKGGRQAHLVRATLTAGPTDSAVVIAGGADRGRTQLAGVDKLTSHRADGDKFEGKAVKADNRAAKPPALVKPSSARGSAAMIGVKYGTTRAPIGIGDKGRIASLGAEPEAQPSSSMSMSTSEPNSMRVPAFAAVSPTVPVAHATSADTAGKDVASACRPSMEVSVNAATVQGERHDGELDLSDDSSDCALDATTRMDDAPSPNHLARSDSVPLRDHLAQMRHNAASQVHTSPWGQAEAKQGGTSGAEERGQEALLRWMHRGTDNCSGDRGEGGAEGVDEHAQDQVTSSSHRPSGLATKDEDGQLASFQSAEGDPDLDSDSSMGEEDGEDEEDDLAEYESLCTKIAEISRDVGALPSTVPRTTSSVVEDCGDELSPVPSPEYIVPSYGRNANPSNFATAAPLPAEDPERERALVPKPLDADVANVAQRASQDSSNDAFKAPDTARGDSDETQADLAGQHDPVSPRLSPCAVTDEPAKTAGADAVNTRDGIETTDPPASCPPLDWQAAEDLTGEFLPLKRQVRWVPPSRFTRANSAPKPQGTDTIETAVRGEPPPVPRVSWRPPARISRSTGTSNRAPVPQPVQPVQPMQPHRVQWVTPRALRVIPRAAQCNAPQGRDSEPLYHGIASPSPHHDYSQNGPGDSKSTLDKPRIDKQGYAVKNDASSPGTLLPERERPHDAGIGSAQAALGGGAHHSVKDNNVNGSKAMGSGCGGGDFARSLGVETPRSRSRSNDSRRSSSSRRQRKSRSPTKERDYRQSGRERQGHDRRSPDDTSTGRHLSATSGSRWNDRDSRTTSRHSRGSRGRGDEARDREREMRGTTRDRCLHDGPGRGGDKRDDPGRGGDKPHEPGRGGGKWGEPGRGGDKRDKPGRGGDTRSPHHCDGHDRGGAEGRYAGRGPHPNSRPRRLDVRQGMGSSVDPGDRAGRTQRGERSSSGDDKRR